MNKKKVAVAAFVSTMTVALIAVVDMQRDGRERRVGYRQSLTSSGEAGEKVAIPVTTTDVNQVQQFYQVWGARQRRDVASEILPYLRSPYSELRIYAARALGRLEDPEAEPALAQLLQEQESLLQEHRRLYQISQKSPDEQNRLEEGGKRVAQIRIPAVTLQLALGRIRSRHLKGQERLVVVAKSLGLSWEGLVRLSQDVSDPRTGSSEGTPGDEIVQDVVALLYVMGKEGQDVRPIAARLTLNPSQKLLLQGAMLPVEQEIDLILDYLVQLGPVTGDIELLKWHLVSLASHSTQLVLDRLQAMKQQPAQYFGERRRGYSVVFNIAGHIGDRRAIPLLESFRKYPDKWVPHYADNALRNIKLKSSSAQDDEISKALSVPMRFASWTG